MKKKITAFLQIIYLNSWANNTYEIQHFLIEPWSYFGPLWSCFGAMAQNEVHVDQY